MKWLLDVNITKKIELYLKSESHDVVSLVSLGIRELRNGDVLAKSKELDRVLLSFDRDFISLTRGDHPGVVVIKIHPNTDENVIPVFSKFLHSFKTKNLENTLIIIEKDKIISRSSD